MEHKRSAVKSVILFSFIAVVSWSITGCNSHKAKKEIGILPDSTVYSDENFTDKFLDSASVGDFLVANQIPDSASVQVSQFYERRNYQFAWLNSKELQSSVDIFLAQLNSYEYEFDDQSLHNTLLDSLLLAAQKSPKAFIKDKNSSEQLELLLTSTFFLYSQKAYGGIDQDPFDLEWFIPRKKKNYQVLLDSLVTNSKDIEHQEPVNRYYTALKAKLKQYRGIQKSGGFPTIDNLKESLTVGDSIPEIQPLKKFLVLVNDLATNDNSAIVDEGLLVAIKHFQERMGLVANGKLDKNTLNELNKPVAEHIRQMMINLERLRWVPAELDSNYLLVNIPEFKLHVFEDHKLVWETNVVVGKEVHKTSIFKGNISQVVFNPYWGIPNSIVQNEILPKIRRDPNYLSRNNMEVVNGYYRQKPGRNNALGKIKFLFPNQYSIYLHDTPSKSLFESNTRAFSHGCIRVKDPKKLAMIMLRNYPEWSEDRVDKILATTKETQVNIKPTVPVYIAYFTSWVDNTGQLNFRKDIYGLDKKLSKDIFGEN
ncbi:Murein L,D-transpeptidase YcbB/YkuD [Spirosomataceae bacterium TFI 002]|nr:Murein L,D-transpeptidase YcbB/YkuD [Spirosomataceae bacterium TFI 002]